MQPYSISIRVIIVINFASELQVLARAGGLTWPIRLKFEIEVFIEFINFSFIIWSIQAFYEFIT